MRSAVVRSWRKSAVADRYIALGSKLEDWNGMGTAWTYDADILKVYMAIRTAAGSWMCPD
jgi:aminomethyltransferase